MKNLPTYTEFVNESDESEELNEGKTIKFNGKKVKMDSLSIDGVDHKDYPDFVDTYFASATYTNGKDLTDDELDKLTDEYAEIAQEMAMDQATGA